MVEPGAESSALLRWIPLLPLAGALLHGALLGLVRRESPRRFVIGVSCGAVGLAFLLSIASVFQLAGLPSGERLLHDELYTWIGAGHFFAEAALRLDPISAVMILVVTGVGFLIHIYSVGYMDDDHREDGGFQRFFAYLNLFTFSMLVLVLADNLVLMFLGWEGVGLCSYLLIGFWYSDRYNAYCGAKAFIVNRIGDAGFLIGIFLTFWALVELGSPGVGFGTLAANVPELAEMSLTLPWLGAVPLLEVIGLCLFVGAVGKSAQLPLYVWLPDAMAGPTPVSALIHAATMVTAGVYMVCRLSMLYAEAPVASAVIAWTGALTALFAATIALAQTDIKKVLAYSTVSQLGYMFLAAGCGGYAAAMFHLTTHAFFKALLFMAAGSVIIAMHHEQDTDRMGGLWRRIPRTHLTFLAGVIAISGFPPLSGFFSKDEILLSAFQAHVPGHTALYAIGLGTAALTAFYMFRLHFRTFAGPSRVPDELAGRVREPASWVLQPLYVLAILSVVGGAIGLPQAYGDWLGVEHSNSLVNFLAPAVAEGAAHGADHALEYRLAVFATLAAGVGLAAAYLLYVRRPELPAQVREALNGLARLVQDKYRVDELYDAAIVRPLVRVSDAVLYRGVDAGLIDGIGANGSARAVQALAARGLKYAQSGLAQAYLLLMVVGAIAIVGYLLR